MITRRTLVLIGTANLFAMAARSALADPPTANDPVAIINAIYMRVAKGNGNGGGAFVIENKSAKAKYLSKSLIELWAKADAHTPKGNVGPVDFDPVTNSQDPDVKSFNINPEKLDAGTAVIAVIITGTNPRANANDAAIRYDFVRDGGHWKIDDIRGAEDGKPWSVRSMLGDTLK
jgi:hypothetical protein